jgi:hypothetical protein
MTYMQVAAVVAMAASAVGKQLVVCEKSLAQCRSHESST